MVTNLDAKVAKHLYNIYIHYAYMSVTVSYRQPARGLKIVSVFIPMASSCFILLCLSHFESSTQAATNLSLHL